MLWCRFLSNQHHLYPHMSRLITEIMLVMLASSSVVERGFSTVRRLLRENRLSMQNARLNQVLIVKCNLPVLRKIIRDAVDSILNEAVELYKSKKKWRWNLHKSDRKNKEKVNSSLLVQFNLEKTHDFHDGLTPFQYKCCHFFNIACYYLHLGND